MIGRHSLFITLQSNGNDVHCVYARARMLGRLDGVGSPNMCRMRATEIRWSAFSVGFLAPCTTIVYAAAIRLITSGSKTS